jgi:hypothetical protein
MANSKKSSIKTLILLLIFLPIVIFAVTKIVELRKGAAGTYANISIDTKSLQGQVPVTLWQNFSQGGEEPRDMIGPVISQTRLLKPKLIRIDHLFDYFNVYQGNNNYNFTELDKAVNSVLATGAKPMLSISYTTASMSKDGQNAGEPKDWNEWYGLVKATARHYSVEKNISGIYYEVWNEPDLFGGWKYNKSPNYSTLYIQTARGIIDGAGGSIYKIGGPAITAYYSNWIKSLFKTAADNHVRLDFISWHKYSKNMEDYENDFNNLNQILSNYPQYFNIERLITEVGPNPEPDVWYDNNLSGVHLISLATHMYGKIHRLFSFEVVDGPTSRSEKSPGWGMITHPSKGAKPKPRYFAIQFLNKLQGQLLSSTGDGSWVTSMSAKNGNTIQSLVVNYDSRSAHSETFPITFKNLDPGKYEMRTTYYMGNTNNKIITIDQNSNSYSQSFYLDPNTSALIELTPTQ